MLFYLEILGLVVLTILVGLLLGVVVWAFKQTLTEDEEKAKDEFNHNPIAGYDGHPKLPEPEAFRTEE